VSGLTNAFPAESLALYAAIRAGDLARARSIYRWFMPLLHLDAEHDLVQSIKLAEADHGPGLGARTSAAPAARRRAPRCGDRDGRACPGNRPVIA
jgi:dihydrodipicolinate synthase/N-acetylneuraminate lyase